MMKRWFIMLSAVCLLLFCSCEREAPPPASPQPSVSEQTTAHENAVFVKAVWVPFMEVNGLLASGDPALCEQAIDAMLDDCVSRGANTVYFHVRANSDAYYASSVFSPHALAAPLLEQGFDPLGYAVDAAHERGLSLHAWVNPYRIGSDNGFAKTEDIFEYNGKWYYIPTKADNQALIVEGIRELVQTYAIDGVQFDDYFYPKGAVAADTPSAFEADEYAAYAQVMTIADWRRAQVSALIADVYAACHARENCVFGVSPGYDIDDNYNGLYADIPTWAKTVGYIDYVCPQLYFGYEHGSAPFDELLKTWSALPRANGVKLYAGLALYKTGLAEDTYAGTGKTEWAAGGDILARQLADVYEAKWDGAALYSHLSFEAEDGRNQTVVAAECEAAVAAWKEF